MALPHIIVLTTLKGGSGKSTVAASLAVHWHNAGREAALVDADPQRSISAWSELNSLELPVEADASEGVRITIGTLARDHRPVVVDTAGFRNRTTIEAIAVANLAIVPVKASPMDVRVARDTADLVDEINETMERRGRPVAVRFLLTQTTPRSVIAGHIRAQMLDAGMKLFKVELANRVAYGEAALSGLTPTLTAPRSAAALDIAALASEIESLRIKT